MLSILNFVIFQQGLVLAGTECAEDLSTQVVPIPNPPVTLDDLPLDVIREITKYTDVSDYASEAKVNKIWNEAVTDSWEYRIQKLFNQLLASEAAIRGSSYQQMKFLDFVYDVMDSQIKRQKQKGRLTSFLRSLMRQTEQKRIRLGQFYYRGPFKIFSPLLRVAENQRLSPEGQWEILELASQLPFDKRYPLLFALVRNPQLDLRVADEMFRAEFCVASASHEGKETAEFLLFKIAMSPAAGTRRQERYFQRIGEMKQFPVSMSWVTDFVRRPHLSERIQKELFDRVFPQIFALPLTSRFHYQVPLERSLASNPSLLQGHQLQLFRWIMDRGHPRAEHWEPLVLLASAATSVQVQEEVWGQFLNVTDSELSTQFLEGFAANESLSEGLQKKWLRVVESLLTYERAKLFLRLSSNPHLRKNLSQTFFEEGLLALDQAEDFPDILQNLARDPNTSRATLVKMIDWIQKESEQERIRKVLRPLLSHPQLNLALFNQLYTWAEARGFQDHPQVAFDFEKILLIQRR
jgi:hypothetical protein